MRSPPLPPPYTGYRQALAEEISPQHAPNLQYYVAIVGTLSPGLFCERHHGLCTPPFSCAMNFFAVVVSPTSFSPRRSFVASGIARLRENHGYFPPAAILRPVTRTLFRFNALRDKGRQDSFSRRPSPRAPLSHCAEKSPDFARI